MTDNLDRTHVDFPHEPKERNVGSVDVNDVVGGLASTSILPYMHRSYANPLITTAAVLKTGGKVMRRARKLRRQLYEAVPNNFSIDVGDMDGHISGTSISLNDILDTMKTINTPGIPEGERHAARAQLAEVMKYLWYPNSKVNDVKYSKNARKVFGFIISNDVVKDADRTVYESLVAYDRYLAADRASGGMSMRNSVVRADTLFSVIDGNASASREVLAAAQEIEMQLATHIDGKAFWQADDSGIVHYSLENEAAFLGRALTNTGQERDSVAAMNSGNTNVWIADRLSTIRSIAASRYDYNKVAHMQMGRLKANNKTIYLMYMAYGVSVHDAIGHNFDEDISTLLRS